MPRVCAGIFARQLNLHLIAFQPRASLCVTGRDSTRPAGIPLAAHVGHQALVGWLYFAVHNAQGHTASWPTALSIEGLSNSALGSLGHAKPWGTHWLVAHCWHLFTSLQWGWNICRSQHAWPLSLWKLAFFPTSSGSSLRKSLPSSPGCPPAPDSFHYCLHPPKLSLT